MTFTKFDVRQWEAARTRNPDLFNLVETICASLQFAWASTPKHLRIEMVETSPLYHELREAVLRLPESVRPVLRNPYQAAIWSHLLVARLARRAL